MGPESMTTHLCIKQALISAMALVMFLPIVQAGREKMLCEQMECFSGTTIAPEASWRSHTKHTKYIGTYSHVIECERECQRFKARFEILGISKVCTPVVMGLLPP